MARTPDIDENYINEVIKATEAYDPALNKTQGIKLRELVSKICTHFKGEDEYIIGLLTDIVNGLTAKVNSAEKGAANGVATLGIDAKVPNSQLPALAISDTFPVSSESAMLSISGAEKGDVAIRTDIRKSFILTQTPASTPENWQELLSPSDAVRSVNGMVGDVIVVTSNVYEGANLYYTDARVNAVVDPKLANKQNTLVSGTNIKTINGISILGYGDIPLTATNTYSGIYTPAITIGQNGTEVYPQACTYTVVGNVVTVFGNFAIGIQNEGVCEVNISLPYQTIESIGDLKGHGSCVNGLASDVVVTGSSSNNKAHLQMTSNVSEYTATVFFSFQYIVAYGSGEF